MVGSDETLQNNVGVIEQLPRVRGTRFCFRNTLFQHFLKGFGVFCVSTSWERFKKTVLVKIEPKPNFKILIFPTNWEFEVLGRSSLAFFLNENWTASETTFYMDIFNFLISQQIKKKTIFFCFWFFSLFQFCHRKRKGRWKRWEDFLVKLFSEKNELVYNFKQAHHISTSSSYLVCMCGWAISTFLCYKACTLDLLACGTTRRLIRWNSTAKPICSWNMLSDLWILVTFPSLGHG